MGHQVKLRSKILLVLQSIFPSSTNCENNRFFFYKIKKAVDTHKIKTSSTVYVVKVTSFDMRNVPTPFLELPGEKMPKTLVAYHNY